jgi:benzoyl-CoA reductase/2-hydroxyglutaryl-CoA dehydratase subunit BcrC/BadD/HgdB
VPTAGESSAVTQLRWHYENRHAAALERYRAGRSIVGVTSNTVPRELIEAAGIFPLLLSPQPVEQVGHAVRRGPSAPPHEIFLESVFDARTRSIFDFLVSGEGDFLKLVIVPRTSEPEHKLFLYLKEIQRQQSATNLPDVYLYNLLHSHSDEARRYSWERTLDLKRRLEELIGDQISSEGLRSAIYSNNEARKAARKIVELRESPQARLSGSEAVELLGARYFIEASEYAQLAAEAAREIEAREPLQGPCILIKGFPLDHPHLHREIETHGALVFGEDDWWGARGATQDIATEGDPLEAIFEHYYSDEISPRVLPLEAADRWFRETAQRADGVVFYLPPDDDVIGWDYPRHHKFLDELGIPHLLVRVDAAHFARPAADGTGAWHREDEQALAAETTRESIAEFVGKLL